MFLQMQRLNPLSVLQVTNLQGTVLSPDFTYWAIHFLMQMVIFYFLNGKSGNMILNWQPKLLLYHLVQISRVYKLQNIKAEDKKMNEEEAML